jgi:hypothetical protein
MRSQGYDEESLGIELGVELGTQGESRERAREEGFAVANPGSKPTDHAPLYVAVLQRKSICPWGYWVQKSA